MKDTMPYKLPKYIINTILPKCTMAYSEAVSSVYLQILLNVNHQKKCKDWQVNRCWLQPTTISKRIGYNVRTVYKSIGILDQLGLIKCYKKEKLNLYEAVNSDLSEIDKIIEFNNKVNIKLLNEVNDSNFSKYVQFLDKNISDKYLWIKDINELREYLCLVEQMYKGSSLFFIHNFALLSINKSSKMKSMSEEKMALLCGSSQSTVSRYISHMTSNDFLKVQKNIVNKPMKIYLNIINESDKENDNMENNELTCPVCNKLCIETKSLNLHIGRCKDEKHLLLNKLRKENPQLTVNEVFEQHKEEFDKIKTAKKAAPKVEGPKVNTTEIVKYFYDKIESTCQNWPKECMQVKNLIKAGTSVYDIKLTMDYLAKQGSFDLRFLNRSVADAKLFYTYMEDLDKEGTEAHLVKYFYGKMKLPINEQTLINDVRKIKQTINSGSSYEQTKLILDYMVSVNCININFIGNMKTQALLKMSNVNYGNNNPCFNDRTEMDLIKEKLINGNYNINKAEPSQKGAIKRAALDIFKKEEYSNKYNPFEWAYKVGLDLDREIYTIAKNRKTTSYYVDELLNKKTIPANKKDALRNFKTRLNDWINNYEQIYC